MTQEPLDIPALMVFGMSRDQQVRTTARSTIQQLFAQIPLETLPTLDASMRRGWPYVRDWYSLRPQDVKSLTGSTEADRLFLALVTCHPSGFVRAEALRCLSADPSPLDLPFVLLRLADWAAPVASLAEAELRKRLNGAHVHSLVNCLGLTVRLSAQTRFHPQHSLRIETFLRSPQCADALRRGLDSTSYLTRRYCYRIAVENRALSRKDTFGRAATDRDVIVRKWAFTAGSDVIDASLAAGDPYAPIRRFAFDAAVADSSAAPASLTRYLLDRSLSIRRECQSLGFERLGVQPAEFYRARLRSGSSRETQISIIGLAETGDRRDGPAIAESLTHRSGRVRCASIRVLHRLGVEGLDLTLLRIVARDGPSVLREAVRTLLSRRTVTPQAIWEAASTHSDPRARRIVLTQMLHAAKWQQLSLYLQAVAVSDLQLFDCAMTMLRTWLHRYNRSFTQPSPLDKQTLPGLLMRVQERLPAPIARELQSIFEIWAR